jgi:uncharacterized membrane protein required for colicin V production
MSLVIDLLLLALIVVCTAGGIKRGFIRTSMGIITVIAALLGAWYFKPAVSAWLNETYLAEKITEPIAEFIRQLLVPSLDSGEAIPRLFADMPDAFASLLSRYGADAASAQSSVAGATDPATALAHFLAQPAVVIISDTLAFIMLFFGISLALTIIMRLLDLIFKLPVLSALNRVGGLLIGLIIGALYAWVISYVLKISLPYLSQVLPDQFTSSTLADTFIANFFANYNPLSLLDFKFIGS